MTTESLFDRGEEYESMLNQGIRLSGESKDFFMEGRVMDLFRSLPASFRPRRILDYGCGTGETSRFLASLCPEATVVGVDSSRRALECVRESGLAERISFGPLALLEGEPPFDLCYMNGVLHHVAPEDRLALVRTIRHCLAPEGFLALFDNNPLNPGTRLVMRRIPFDRDAIPVHAAEARRLLREGGFARIERTRYLFYFPRWLRALRFVEPSLAHVPLGAQYFVLARRAS